MNPKTIDIVTSLVAFLFIFIGFIVFLSCECTPEKNPKNNNPDEIDIDNIDN